MATPHPRVRATVPAFVVSALLLAACQNTGSSPAASAGASTAASIALTVSHTAAGDALAGPNGMTLYVLTSDGTNNASTCTSGACANAWPALKGDGSQVSAGSGISGSFGTATWADGTKQVTHNGQPLYYYIGDAAPGDAKGQGTQGVWFIAPVGSTPTQGAASGGASATPYKAPGY